MNIDKLSKRLETVASFIKPDMRIADIGSDHAYLPCYAVNQGLAKAAIAGEVVEGPYQSAYNQVKEAELSDRIAVRKGNGLTVVNQGEVDCIIIAGMGGALITDILENGKQKLVEVQRLILQPNVAAEKVRKWLLDNNWQLSDERLIEEDGKYYEILVADRDKSKIQYSNLKKELLLGPYLLNSKDEVFHRKWRSELNQWKIILNELDKAESNEKTAIKKRDLIEKISIVEEALS